MRMAGALAAMMALASCAKGQQEETITETNATKMVKVLNTSNEVTPEEAQLVTAYLARRELAKTLAPDNVPPLGKTVREIISAQRAFQAEQELAEARRQAEAQREAARRQAEADAAKTALRAAVSASVTSVEVQAANMWRGQYRDRFWVKTRITNTGSKPLKGARIRLTFKNTFGQAVAHMTLNCEADIAPGATLEDGYGGDFNQFDENDRAIVNFDLARGTVEYEPLHVVFADGSQVQLPEDGPGAATVTPPAAPPGLSAAPPAGTAPTAPAPPPPPGSQ